LNVSVKKYLKNIVGCPAKYQKCNISNILVSFTQMFAQIFALNLLHLVSVQICDFGISGNLVDSVAKTMDAGCKPYMAVSCKHLLYRNIDTLGYFGAFVNLRGQLPK